MELDGVALRVVHVLDRDTAGHVARLLVLALAVLNVEVNLHPFVLPRLQNHLGRMDTEWGLREHLEPQRELGYILDRQWLLEGFGHGCVGHKAVGELHCGVRELQERVG